MRRVPLAWSIKGLGDFNLDNKMDIVCRNSSTGENYVYPMDGTTTLPGEGSLPTESCGAIPRPGPCTCGA
jgi:hypothetical protein